VGKQKAKEINKTEKYKQQKIKEARYMKQKKASDKVNKCTNNL